MDTKEGSQKDLLLTALLTYCERLQHSAVDLYLQVKIRSNEEVRFLLNIDRGIWRRENKEGKGAVANARNSGRDGIY